MKILSIETSCDETAAAVVESADSGEVKVLSHVFDSSLSEHIQTGGIVPEVAARSQLESIMPVLHQALLETGQEVDAIAVTQGPGLIGSLLVGVETAKALALTWNKPLVPVNHLLGHVYANWIRPQDVGDDWQPPRPPALALIISGGHTELVLLESHGQYQILGGTRDDAVGECFDKSARALGLPYPGGPEISKLANQFTGDKELAAKLLPRPLIHEDTLDTSFSGLKAAFVREVNQTSQEDKQKLAYALEGAISDILAKKVLAALERFPIETFLLCGGVAANQRLREQLSFVCQQKQVRFYVPDIIHCTDNAAMIGAAAVYNYQSMEPVDLRADPGLGL